MAEARFPNPAFWRCKDQINRKALAKALGEAGDAVAERIREADWKAFAARQGRQLALSGKRVAEEARAFAAMSGDERRELLLHGEKRLGKLRRSGCTAAVRREWRGVGDTAYDFCEWARLWGMLLTTLGRAPLPLLSATLRYRWMASFFRVHSFVDKSTMGQRGAALRMSRRLSYDVFRSAAESLALLAKCDARSGNSAELSKKVVLYDDMAVGRIMAGFPELLGVPYQLLPVLLASRVDPLACVPCIDAAERFGIPADACSAPASVCGAIVADALPHAGACFITGSMPCDGSAAAASCMARRFPSLPVFRLAIPARREHEEAAEDTEEIKRCIRFIEEAAGATWSWDAYFTRMKRYQMETQYELQRRELNQTARPQLVGPCYELFRRWSRELDGGADPRVVQTFEKVNRLMLEAFERREEAWRGKMKYRAIAWPCAPHCYADISNWLANCWGVDVLAELDCLDDAAAPETGDRELALRDLARLCGRARCRMGGGCQDDVNELWRQCELWKADMILVYQNVACKSMAALQGVLDEQARQRGCRLVWVEHDLMDPRTVSRRAMRERINGFMYAVMGATPVDESLVDFEDDAAW